MDLDRLRAAAHGPVAKHRDVAELLFVGRLTEHKCQHDLIEAFAALRSRLGRPSRLTLVGTGAEPYLSRLHARAAALGLDRAVRFAGRLLDEELYAAYQGADLFICLSEHEGFGMPLVEAAAFGVPVLAYDAGNVADTVGEGGIVLGTKAPEVVAAAAKLLLEEPALRRRITEGQVRTLARYEPAALLRPLAGFLRKLGFEMPGPPSTKPTPSPTLRIEGPFDSSYSLAIVNRELALALERLGARSALRSMDGPGDFPPDPGFLARHPEIEALWRRGATPAGAVLRNMYPPLVDDMPGAAIRGLACYAWEETAFPAAWAEAFNRSLDLITVTSAHVRKTLQDNGVRTPIRVVGNGVDHILRVAPRPPQVSLHDGFRFLHISSCFPRKGPDVLLEAWGRAFGREDPVSLVIKTFPNPHQAVAAEIAALAERHPDHAPVVLIDRDMDASEMRGLYEACDAFVAPARCEGFGLPVAEAMLLGKPVIVTAFSGQMDFCTSETVWLVDYRFAPSGSHLDLPGSAWADPDVDDLARQLRAVFSAPPAARAARVEAARALVRSRYTWDAVAARVRDAVSAARSRPAPEPLPRVAWVSTWNSRCGIATYSQGLTSAMPPAQLRVFADSNAMPLGPDGPGVERPWRSGWDDDLEGLHRAIVGWDADAVVLQFNFGLFDLAAFGRLVERLAGEGRAVFVTLHATGDVEKPERRISLRDAVPALSRARRLLVHSIADLNRLKGFGLVENVTLFPHGFPQAAAVDSECLRAALGLAGRQVVASFGFMLPHKGLRELLRAFALLHRQDRRRHLLMLNALYPAAESETELAACRVLIDELGLGGCVTLVPDFLEEREALALLGLADVVVHPYQHTQEAASGAVRLGLAAGRPVAVTPLPIFDDVAPITHRLPGAGAEEIARGLGALLRDGRLRAETAARQARWLEEHGWPRLSRRLWSIIRACRTAGDA